MVQAVLFDADGVLVDACELHYISLNRALGTMGWTITREEHENVYNGLPTAKKLELLSQAKDFPRDWHSAVHSLKQEFTLDAIEECLSFDRSKRDLLKELHALGIRTAVCSNSLRKSLHRMLQKIGIDDLIEIALGNDDVSRPKPDPEMYLLAAEGLGASIGNCLIVEDSEVGLEAARAAKPLGIIHVEGPHEVNPALMTRIETYLGIAKEAA